MNPVTKPSRGRPAGTGPTINLLNSLAVGDSLLVPAAPTDAALLQVARNKFYTPAKRLGISLSFTMEDGSVRVKREA